MRPVFVCEAVMALVSPEAIIFPDTADSATVTPETAKNMVRKFQEKRTENLADHININVEHREHMQIGKPISLMYVEGNPFVDTDTDSKDSTTKALRDKVIAYVVVKYIITNPNFIEAFQIKAESKLEHLDIFRAYTSSDGFVRTDIPRRLDPDADENAPPPPSKDVTGENEFLSSMSGVSLSNYKDDKSEFTALAVCRAGKKAGTVTLSCKYYREVPPEHVVDYQPAKNLTTDIYLKVLTNIGSYKATHVNKVSSDLKLINIPQKRLHYAHEDPPDKEVILPSERRQKTIDMSTQALVSVSTDQLRDLVRSLVHEDRCKEQSPPKRENYVLAPVENHTPVTTEQQSVANTHIRQQHSSMDCQCSAALTSTKQAASGCSTSRHHHHNTCCSVGVGARPQQHHVMDQQQYEPPCYRGVYGSNYHTTPSTIDYHYRQQAGPYQHPMQQQQHHQPPPQQQLSQQHYKLDETAKPMSVEDVKNALVDALKSQQPEAAKTPSPLPTVLDTVNKIDTVVPTTTNTDTIKRVVAEIMKRKSSSKKKAATDDSDSDSSSSSDSHSESDQDGKSGKKAYSVNKKQYKRYKKFISKNKHNKTPQQGESVPQRPTENMKNKKLKTHDTDISNDQTSGQTGGHNTTRQDDSVVKATSQTSEDSKKASDDPLSEKIMTIIRSLAASDKSVNSQKSDDADKTDEKMNVGGGDGAKDKSDSTKSSTTSNNDAADNRQQHSAMETDEQLEEGENAAANIVIDKLGPTVGRPNTRATKQQQQEHNSIGEQEKEVFDKDDIKKIARMNIRRSGMFV